MGCDAISPDHVFANGRRCCELTDKAAQQDCMTGHQQQGPGQSPCASIPESNMGDRMLCEEHEGLQQQLERALMAAGGMACKDSCHAEAAEKCGFDLQNQGDQFEGAEQQIAKRPRAFSLVQQGICPSSCHIDVFMHEGGCETWHRLDQLQHHIDESSPHSHDDSTGDVPDASAMCTYIEDLAEQYRCEQVVEVSQMLHAAIEASGGVTVCSACEREYAGACNMVEHHGGEAYEEGRHANLLSYLQAQVQTVVTSFLQQSAEVCPDECSPQAFVEASGCDAWTQMQQLEDQDHPQHSTPPPIPATPVTVGSGSGSAAPAPVASLDLFQAAGPVGHIFNPQE